MVERKNIKEIGKPDPEWDDASDPWTAYLEYNKILRTWFVAFGVGGPALFLVNEKVAQRLAERLQLELVATLFLLGVTAQVVGALVNKTANWYVYRSAWGDEESKKLHLRFANWLIEQFWLDIFLDVITAVSFGIAAWKLFTVFVAR